MSNYRDLADIAMGFNTGPPIMSREEFEARKADLKRKRELEMRRERCCLDFFCSASTCLLYVSIINYVVKLF